MANFSLLVMGLKMTGLTLRFILLNILNHQNLPTIKIALYTILFFDTS